MANEIDYTAVLADMEAKRTALDSAIAGIRQWLSLGGGSEDTLGATSPQAEKRLDSPEIKFDSFFGLSIPDAIRKFLAMTKRPQSVSDITKAFQEGGMTTTSKNLLTTVGSTLSRLKQVDGDLVSVQGKWGLREWYPGMRDEKVAKAAKSTKRGRPKGSKAKANAEPKAPSSKPTPEQIEQIRKLGAVGKKPGEIAKEVGLHHFAVMGVLKSKKAA
jgi:hypothetical protein